MSRSQLVYQVVEPEQGPEQRTVVTLHGYKGAGDDLVPLASSLGPGTRVLAVESLNCVFESRYVTGRFWYRILELGNPEPGSLGDSLWELEQFMYDLMDNMGAGFRPPYLLGYDQGAVMALFLSLIMPEYLAGVIAVRGYVPDLGHWPIDARDMGNLPVFLVRDPLDEQFPASLIEETASRLSDRGARVTTLDVAGADTLDGDIKASIREWLSKQDVPVRGLPSVPGPP
jgi:predicted esterase